VFWSLILAAPVVSRATVVYSNFGLSFAFDQTQGNSIGNDLVGDNLAEAETFTPGANFTFTALEIALSCAVSCPGSDPLTVSLQTSTAGLPSGTALETFTVAGGTLPTLGTSLHQTFTSILNPALTSGTKYWVVVIDALGNNQSTWSLNTTGATATNADSIDGGTSWNSPTGQTPGAFEVDGSTGSVTPEPGTLGMMLGGGLLLGLIRKIRG